MRKSFQIFQLRTKSFGILNFGQSLKSGWCLAQGFLRKDAATGGAL